MEVESRVGCHADDVKPESWNQELPMSYTSITHIPTGDQEQYASKSVHKDVDAQVEPNALLRVCGRGPCPPLEPKHCPYQSPSDRSCGPRTWYSPAKDSQNVQAIVMLRKHTVAIEPAARA